MLSERDAYRILEEAMSGSADFADVFIEENKANTVGLLDGKVNKAASALYSGVGIRLMSGTNVVYVHSSDSDVEVLLRMAKEASKALKSGDKGLIKELQARCHSTPSNVQIDPFNVNKNDIVNVLKASSDYAKNYHEKITQTLNSYSYSTRRIHIINSDGLNKSEDQSRSRLSIEVIASDGNEKQTGREAPGTMCGFEFINEYPIIDKTRECCDSALRMLSAGYAPSGRMPVILGNGFGGVIFHEACGHSLESTSVGIKASCFTDMLDKQIASPVVTAYDKARIVGEWGSYMIDDEGHESSDLLLIENGILKNYLVDKLGGRRMGCESTGCGRRESYSYAPTSRMSNTFIAPGNETPESIIADTESGIYCSKLGGGSVDTATGEFNFAASEAYIIRNGKICEPVRGATLIGKGAEVLMNIDRVGNDLELSAGMCGSISGSVPVTVGQPTIRLSSILVGGRK